MNADEAPTGLTVAAGAKHGYVEITWDEPPADSNQRYEVQVATWTDTSCGSTGPWSASQYATAR